MPGKIFLSYRRDDSEGYVGRIQDHLESRFPDRIFRDVSGLEPGEDFVDALQREGEGCKALIAVIGRRWLSVTDAAGKRRIDDPADILRDEIVHALQRNIRVIPLLVGGARMPAAEELPTDLAFLARRQALSINEDDFKHDMERLIHVLEKALGEDSGEGHTEAHKAEDKKQDDELATLLRQAQTAMAAQDWANAIPALQAAVSINPSNAQAAGQLRTALQQQTLAETFERGQALYRRQDYRGALECFRQVRVLGGNYQDVDTLIRMVQEHMPTPAPAPPLPVPEAGKPKKLKWIVGGGIAALFLIAGIVKLANQGSSPAPVSNDYESQQANPGSGGGSGVKSESASPEMLATSPASNASSPENDTAESKPQEREFNPVGSWTLVAPARGFSAVVTFFPDSSFAVTHPMGPLSAGKWQYLPQNRTIVMTGIDNTGTYFTSQLQIGRENAQGGYEGYESQLGAVMMARQ